MQKRIQIGLVGDFDENMYTHVALNDCIAHCRPHLAFELETRWLPTEQIAEDFFGSHAFDGLWIAPGSPYRNDDGVYQLIRWCRENNFPLLGTCGGFQYMLVEYAKNVLGIHGAGHEESEPGSNDLIVTKMSCSLKGQTEEVAITDDSWLHEVLRSSVITARYNCSYGLNPAFVPILDRFPLRFTAFTGPEVRAFELQSHWFYAGTLFQPPLDCTAERPNPLVIDFLNRCATR